MAQYAAWGFVPYVPGLQLVHGDDLNQLYNAGFVTSEGGITATAAGGQAAAYQLTRTVSHIDTAAAIGASVKLAQGQAGKVMVVGNGGADSATVFGFNATDQINGSTAGVAVAAGAVTMFFCYKIVANVAYWLSK